MATDDTSSDDVDWAESWAVEDAFPLDANGNIDVAAWVGPAVQYDLTATGDDVAHLDDIDDDDLWLYNTELSHDVARYLLGRSPTVRRNLALADELPADVVDRLVHDDDGDVRATVAKHPQLTTAQMRVLVDDTRTALAFHLARRPDLPDDVGDLVAAHPSSRVARRAYLNGHGDDAAGVAHVDEDIVHAVAQRTDNSQVAHDAYRHSRTRIVAAAAANGALPLDDIADAAAHTDAKVRAAAATNPSCPPELLSALGADSNGTVRAAALTNPAHPDAADTDEALADRWLNDRAGAVRAAAVSRLELTDEQLERAANDPAIAIRVALATRTNLSADLIERLAFDEADEVVAAVAARADLPPEARVWFKLTQDVWGPTPADDGDDWDY